MAVKVIEEAKDGLANTGKNFTDNITKKFESTNSAKKPSIGIDDVLQQKPDKIPEQKPKEVPKQKPNETPEQNTKKPSETDDIITVERGNSGVNGSGVKISGEKPNSNVDDIKTRETSNSIGNAEKPKETNNNTSNSNAADTNNAKPITDIAEYSEYFEKLKEIRNLLPNKYQYVDFNGYKIKNVGYSTSNIEGYSIKPLQSFSQYGNEKNGVINKVSGWISQVENPEYLKDVLKVNTRNKIDDINGYPRVADTEYKIIENYNKILNHDYKATGKIVIISEREVCPSCENVIKSFSKDYKNIELTVIDSNGKTYIVKNGEIN